MPAVLFSFLPQQTSPTPHTGFTMNTKPAEGTSLTISRHYDLDAMMVAAFLAMQHGYEWEFGAVKVPCSPSGTEDASMVAFPRVLVHLPESQLYRFDEQVCFTCHRRAADGIGYWHPVMGSKQRQAIYDQLAEEFR